jgi:hypothetical protein
VSDAQIAFCLRHGIDHDAAWTKGQARRAMDRFIVEVGSGGGGCWGWFGWLVFWGRRSVGWGRPPHHRRHILHVTHALKPTIYKPHHRTKQEMRVPATEEQHFYLRHLAPFLPPLSRGARAHTFSRAAEITITNALAGRSAGAGTDSPPLAARRALMADCRRFWAAGMAPKYSWMGVGHQGDLVLDLMSGCYIWLRPAGEQVGSSSGGDGDGSSGSSSSAVPDPEAWPPLDPEAPYLATLELSDGSHVPLTAAVLSDPDLFWPLTPLSTGSADDAGADTPNRPDDKHGGRGKQQRGVVTGGSGDAESTTSSSGSNSSTSRRGRQVAMPLHRALPRAELLAGKLTTAGLAFLSPRHAARLAGAVGGWKVATAGEGGGGAAAAHLVPAGTRQLDALRAAGLPVSRRYSALDAHRELLRAAKARGVGEAPATAAQLARIQELGLALPPPPTTGGGVEGEQAGGEEEARAGGQQRALTFAAARALLFRAVLAREASERRAAAAREAAAGGKKGRPRLTVARLQRAARRDGMRLDV